ncbi:hypothetical protein DRP53_10895, partial [candidate division WOR-3 bacterium]
MIGLITLLIVQQGVGGWTYTGGPPVTLTFDLTVGEDVNNKVRFYAANLCSTVYYLEPEVEDKWKPVAAFYYPPNNPDRRIRWPRSVATVEQNTDLVWMCRWEEDDGKWGVYKSEDGGATWERYWSPHGINNPYPVSLTIDPHDQSHNTVYLGCFTSITTPYVAIYRTSDGGNTWSSLTDLLFGCKYSDQIAINPDDGNWILVCAPQYAGNQEILKGLWLSTDCGVTWSNRLPTHELHAVTYLNGSRAYAGGDEFWISTNGGLNWIMRYTPSGAVVYDILARAQDDIFIATNKGVFHTTDEGQTWEDRNGSGWNSILRASCYTIEEDPKSSTIYVGTWGALYRTSDFGQTWKEITAGMPPVYTHKLVIHNSLVYTAGRVWDTTGYTGSVVAPFVHRSTDGAQSWQGTAPPCIVRSLALVPHNKIDINWQNTNRLIAGFQISGVPHFDLKGTINYSSNGGISWNFAYDPADPGSQLNHLCYNPVVGNYAYACYDYKSGVQDGGFMRSTDYGASWELSSTGLPPDDVLSCDVNPLSGNELYAGTRSHGIYISTDYGATWSTLRAIFIPVTTIKFDPSDPDITYAGTSDGVLKTTDHGANWSFCNTGLPYLYITDLGVDPEEPTIVFGLCQEAVNSSENRFVCSVDGGARWLDLTGEMTLYLHDVEVDRVAPTEPGDFFAGTDHGVYKLSPPWINKHLVSSSEDATFANNGKKLVRNGDVLWCSYESGGAIYAVRSTDCGQSWSKKMEIGEGYCPALDLPEVM